MWVVEIKHTTNWKQIGMTASEFDARRLMDSNRYLGFPLRVREYETDKANVDLYFIICALVIILAVIAAWRLL